MRRLYWQIYATALGILILFAVMSAVFWTVLHPRPADTQLFGAVTRIAEELLPGPERSPAEIHAELERFATWFSVDLAVFDPDGRRLAAVGRKLPAPGPERQESGWLISRRHRPTAAVRLSDGRWLVIRHRRRIAAALIALLLLGVACAIGALPLVRRLTRRLERLQSQVDRLGTGDLAARVDVQGRDEVAALATSFNEAAAQIERLVTGQRQILAGASHELRSPLARIRVAVELFEETTDPAVKERIVLDIQQLDELIEELLLASRLEAIEELERVEALDLLALVATEATVYDAAVEGEPVEIRGDRRLLRRLVLNLLENARRHAPGSPIELSVHPREDGALLVVADRGPGVAPSERERIFEPFYRPPKHREGEAGFGLGLDLARRIARQHRGDVRCLARPGGGTTFEVDLRSA